MAKIKQCRICGNEKLHTFLKLGKTALANSFVKDITKKEQKFPLNVVFCEDCGLVQLDYIVPPEVMFKDYLYFSSTSATIVRHFAEYAREIHRNFTKPDDLVVEIASNDGVLLKNLVGKNVRILGVEPAENVAKVAQDAGVETLVTFFNVFTSKFIEAKYGQAAVITGNNVFAHVGDLHEFVRGMKSLLAPDGVVIIEVPYLIDFYEKKAFDTIYHEHLAVYSLKPLINLFAKHDMELFDVKRQAVQGGSIRFYVQHKGGKRKVSTNVGQLLEKEEQLGLHDLLAYMEFSNEVEDIKKKLLTMLKGFKSEGKKIAAYGAAAKGNTLLQYFGITTDLIEFIADKNKAKIGLLTPGTHIPVVGVEKIMQEKPDYLLILPWNLTGEIIVQQSEFQRSGGKFVIPIPEPKVI
jgi:SAM-dependent methyltransferase